MEAESPWYQRFFERDYYDTFYKPLLAADGPLGEETTRRQTDFIVRALGVAPGARVLDLCCGHGRHSVELARRGYEVVGIDISAYHIELARTAAANAGVEATFIVDDMRSVPATPPFDAIINIFSAFGYLEDDDQDALVIGRVATALRPCGRFLIDFNNTVRTLRHFERSTVQRNTDGSMLIEEREYDVLTGRINALWTVVAANGARHEGDVHIRAYTPAEFRRIIERAGMAVLAAYGEFDEGVPLSFESRRVVLLAEKPG